MANEILQKTSPDLFAFIKQGNYPLNILGRVFKWVQSMGTTASPYVYIKVEEYKYCGFPIIGIGLLVCVWKPAGKY